MIDKIKVALTDGTLTDLPVGCRIQDIWPSKKSIDSPLVAIVNGELTELSSQLYADSIVTPLYGTDLAGYWTYSRSILLLFMTAADQVLNGARVIINHAMNNEFYGEIVYERDVTESDIASIKRRMIEIAESDAKIEKTFVTKSEAVSIFTNNQNEDKLRLLSHAPHDKAIAIYHCQGFYDYFYGPMLPSTGYLKLFDLFSHANGFIILTPGIKDFSRIPPFRELPKLRQVFEDTKKWSKMLDITDAGALNDRIQSGDMDELILISETLQEKELGRIADRIYENIESTKLILIAGPSSSGKTTFSKRLSLHLRVLGLKPYIISMDDYFLGTALTPKKSNGDYDFESIRAVDIPLLNKHLNDLLDGKDIDTVKFNFISGSREETGKTFKMKDNSILLVEGIHALNEDSTYTISKDHKLKIYASALTQLNLDNHSGIYVSDLRNLRRMIRDYKTRGRSAEATLTTWNSVRAGEEKNIFPYQEEADLMFNTTLIYEMSALKKHAEPLLSKILGNSPAYMNAKRLLKLLSYFDSCDDDIIPETSIIREFIGGGYFE